MTTAAPDRNELERRQLRAAEQLLSAIERNSGTREVIREAIEAYFRTKVA